MYSGKNGSARFRQDLAADLGKDIARMNASSSYEDSFAAKVGGLPGWCFIFAVGIGGGLFIQEVAMPSSFHLHERYEEMQTAKKNPIYVKMAYIRKYGPNYKKSFALYQELVKERDEFEKFMRTKHRRN